jgi:ADP-ribose pyrophosphatase YjhB (NUDIX family)
MTPETEVSAVVAGVVRRNGLTALFKRSAAVIHESGKWHCVTGFLEAGVEAQEQAIVELYEETGLRVADLTRFETGPVLEVTDGSRRVWQIHTFTCETATRRLTLNWEHDSYRWASRRSLPGFNQVPWLTEVLAAVSPHNETPAARITAGSG